MMSKYWLKRGQKDDEVVSPDKVVRNKEEDDKKFKNINLKGFDP